MTLLSVWLMIGNQIFLFIIADMFSSLFAIANTVNPSKDSQKKKLTNFRDSSSSFTDTEKFVEEILDKTSAIIFAEIKEENIKQHGEQLGGVVSETIRKQLAMELKNLATIFKNTAYTEGFHAGTYIRPKHM
ncbi:unnamed protein product [Ilex paraguariensis]